MKGLLAVAKGIDAATTLLGRVMFWLSLLMVGIGVYNVVTRYLGRALSMSLGGTVYVTLQTYAYSLIFLLGASYTLKSDAHVRVDIIYTNLGEKAKAWVNIFGTLFLLFPFCVMGILYSRGFVESSWRRLEVNFNAGGVPVYPIKTVIIVAFVLLIIQGLSELIKNAAVLTGDRHIESGEPVTEQLEAI